MRTEKHHVISVIKLTDYPDDVRAGNLFCHNLQFFRNSEMQELGDEFEATAVSKWYKLVDAHSLSCPVFCMYAVEVKKEDDITRIQLNDERLRRFGDYAVMITDVKEFIRRITTNLSEFSCEVIRYIDMINPPGLYKQAIFNPIATKHLLFKHQQEFRVFSHAWALSSKEDFKLPNVQYINEDKKKFPIGDLNDITQQFRTDDLFNGVVVDLKIDWDFCRKDRLQTKLPKLRN